MSTRKLRKALRETFGSRNYRITAAGEIHVKGQMPNTSETGWWFFGWVGERATLARLGLL